MLGLTVVDGLKIMELGLRFQSVQRRKIFLVRIQENTDQKKLRN